MIKTRWGFFPCLPRQATFSFSFEQVICIKFIFCGSFCYELKRASSFKARNTAELCEGNNYFQNKMAYFRSACLQGKWSYSNLVYFSIPLPTNFSIFSPAASGVVPPPFKLDAHQNSYRATQHHD